MKFLKISKSGRGNPQNGALTPKNGAKSKNTQIELKIGTVINFGVNITILNSILKMVAK